jgi:hypothetical protein
MFRTREASQGWRPVKRRLSNLEAYPWRVQSHATEGGEICEDAFLGEFDVRDVHSGAMAAAISLGALGPGGW